MKRIVKNPYLWLLGIVIALSLIIFSTFSSYGKTWDENDTVSLGNHAFTYYTSLGKTTSYFTFYQQKAFYLTRGPAIEALRAAVTNLFNNHTAEFYHLILALFSLTGVIFIFLCVYELTKKISWATLSVILLLTLPRFYGDMFTNSKDVAPLYILAICIYCSLKFFAGNRNKWFLVLIGVVFGLKASLRIVQIYAYPLFAIFAFVHEYWIEKKKISTILFHQILMALSYVFALHVFQPYLLAHPISGLVDMVTASQKFPQILPLLFDGKIYYSNNLRWYYLPKYIAITTPLITLGLFALGNLFILLKKRTLPYLFILALFWIPLAMSALLKPVLYDGWRHFLFVYAPFVIVATVGTWQAFAVLPRKLTYLAISIISIGILLPLAAMIQLHPYEYTYFNEVTGGIKGAYQKYEIDYWGESFKETTEWINIHQKQFASKDGITYVKPCVHMLAEPYLAPKVKIDDSLATLYYCINRPLLPNPGFNHMIHAVERANTPINSIYTK